MSAFANYNRELTAKIALVLLMFFGGVRGFDPAAEVRSSCKIAILALTWCLEGRSNFQIARPIAILLLM
ncbi:MAG: hypothetical protein HC894_01775 [Microcoleus sp. SM1_3_4]|nr:hypothetical protein [Microcoleus sp. SM1_3_4]